MDVDSIPIGVDVNEYIDQEVSQCQLFIAVIGPGWINARDEDGNRRLDKENDFVRIEIESALQRNIPLVPLLLDPAKIPSKQDLPPSLHKLLRRNGMKVRAGNDFNRDMDRLIKGIESHFNAPAPTPQTQTQPSQPKDEVATKAPAPPPKSQTQPPQRQETIVSKAPAPITTLEQHFQNLIELEPGISITTKPISGNHYQQFLEAQAAGQFHSTAKQVSITPEQLAQPIQGLSRIDRDWFCAWLATQNSLNSGADLYDYRVPTLEQFQQARLKNQDPFYLVRFTLPSHYRNLVKFLSQGQWVDADKETKCLMLHILGKDPNNYLNSLDLKKFPCEDLGHINQLWIKTSGGRFGFTVQKKIWEECGSPKSYNKAWKKFGDRVGWRAHGEWRAHTLINPSLSSPEGILPGICGWWGMWGGISNFPWSGWPRVVRVGGSGGFQCAGVFGGSLFSRVQACEL